jgi:hypothetical protein
VNSLPGVDRAGPLASPYRTGAPANVTQADYDSRARLTPVCGRQKSQLNIGPAPSCRAFFVPNMPCCRRRAICKDRPGRDAVQGLVPGKDRLWVVRPLTVNLPRRPMQASGFFEREPQHHQPPIVYEEAPTNRAPVSRLQRDRHGASETIGAPRRENLRYLQGMQRQGTNYRLRHRPSRSSYLSRQ